MGTKIRLSIFIFEKNEGESEQKKNPKCKINVKQWI